MGKEGGVATASGTRMGAIAPARSVGIGSGPRTFGGERFAPVSVKRSAFSSDTVRPTFKSSVDTAGGRVRSISALKNTISYEAKGNLASADRRIGGSTNLKKTVTIAQRASTEQQRLSNVRHELGAMKPIARNPEVAGAQVAKTSEQVRPKGPDRLSRAFPKTEPFRLTTIDRAGRQTRPHESLSKMQPRYQRPDIIVHTLSLNGKKSGEKVQPAREQNAFSKTLNEKTVKQSSQSQERAKQKRFGQITESVRTHNESRKTHEPLNNFVTIAKRVDTNNSPKPEGIKLPTQSEAQKTTALPVKEPSKSAQTENRVHGIAKQVENRATDLQKMIIQKATDVRNSPQFQEAAAFVAKKSTTIQEWVGEVKRYEKTSMMIRQYITEHIANRFISESFVATIANPTRTIQASATENIYVQDIRETVKKVEAVQALYKEVNPTATETEVLAVGQRIFAQAMETSQSLKKLQESEAQTRIDAVATNGAKLTKGALTIAMPGITVSPLASEEAITEEEKLKKIEKEKTIEQNISVEEKKEEEEKEHTTHIVEKGAENTHERKAHETFTLPEIHLERDEEANANRVKATEFVADALIKGSGETTGAQISQSLPYTLGLSHPMKSEVLDGVDREDGSYAEFVDETATLGTVSDVTHVKTQVEKIAEKKPAVRVVLYQSTKPATKEEYQRVLQHKYPHHIFGIAS